MFVQKKEIGNKIIDATQNKWVDPTNKFIGFNDAKYYAPARQEIENYLYHNGIRLMPNDPLGNTEGFDCDDFAFALKGNIAIFNRNVARKPHSWAVGLIWGEFDWVPGPHVINWVFTRDNGLFLIEPQNGKLENFGRCKGNISLVVL
ncbi:MAG: lectin MOA-related protein [bacterium]